MGSVDVVAKLRRLNDHLAELTDDHRAFVAEMLNRNDNGERLLLPDILQIVEMAVPGEALPIDPICRNGTVTALRKLEVKGLSGSSMNVELTPNEYFHMKSRRQNYAICIVVNALEARPCLSVFRFAQDTGNWRDEDGRSLSVTECIGARLSAE
jgi:hypothetical protein